MAMIGSAGLTRAKKPIRPMSNIVKLMMKPVRIWILRTPGEPVQRMTPRMRAPMPSRRATQRSAATIPVILFFLVV